MGIEGNVVRRLVDGLNKALPKWNELIDNSFLNDDFKVMYKDLITSRLSRLASV